MKAKLPKHNLFVLSSSKVIRIRTHAALAKHEAIKEVLKPLSRFINAMFAEKYATVSGVNLLLSSLLEL